MRNTLLLAIGTFVAFPAVSSPLSINSHNCESALLSKQDSFLLLPAHSKRLAIGVLVEDTSGGHYLGLADFFGSDAEALDSKVLTEVRVRKVLWRGFLVLENSLPQPANAKILRSAAIAGSGKVPAWEALDHTLSTAAPDLLAASAQHSDVNQLPARFENEFMWLERAILIRERLHQGLPNLLRRIISRAHESGPLPNEAAGGRGRYYQKAPSGSWREALRELYDEIDFEQLDTLSFFCEVLMEFPTDRFDLQQLAKVRDGFDLFSRRRLKTHDQFQSLISNSSTLKDYFDTYSKKVRYQVIEL